MRCGRHLLYFIIFSFPDVLNRDRTFCLLSPLGKTWRILFQPPLRVLAGPLNVLLNFCCYRDYNNMGLVSNLSLLLLLKHSSVLTFLWLYLKLFIHIRVN